MQSELYSDMLRATARFTTDGRPVDRNRANLMAFRLMRKEQQDTAHMPRPHSLLRMAIAILKGHRTAV